MLRKLGLLIIILSMITGCFVDNANNGMIKNNIIDTWEPGSGWTLKWSDEFNTSKLNADKWSFQEAAAGRFNNELQMYTKSSENCFVTNKENTDGVMVIKAIKSGNSFTSARMITHGKFDFQYGKIAARIQVPYGQGIWPAFWMLGSNISENEGGTVDWPKCGEIDIMEKIGGTDQKEKEVLGTAHYWNDDLSKWEYESKSKILLKNLSDDFHVYEVEWNENSLIWRIDGMEYHTMNITDSIFNEFRAKFYILLNVAVGGGLPGYPDSTTTFPQSMYVDWVRVYQK